MQLTHLSERTPGTWTLSDYRDQIIREIDGVALRVGTLLREAKAKNPDRFNEWVINDLPFGLETARRLMGISAAYEKLPPDKLRLLPRPWQAMYALKALPREVIEQGMTDRVIHPEMTVEEAKRYARKQIHRGSEWNGWNRLRRVDIQAGVLMQFGAHELSPGVREALRAWLERADEPASVRPMEPVAAQGPTAGPGDPLA